MTTSTVQTRKGAYVDSVALMQVSRRVGALDGVSAAIVAMATELNLEMAANLGFEVPAGTSPNEMLLAVTAATEEDLARALAEVDTALAETNRPAAGGFGAAPPPLTVGAAARHSGADLVLVSTPGRYAFADAVDAVDAGAHVMVFSDNVPVAQEVALKEYAEERGVLVMGPDCGTAVVGGVGLGFANVVRPGPVGMVAASGTGAQQVMALLDHAGVGISHCLGVGGRDLSEAVGARSTLHALDLLAADDSTQAVLVVSKPPADEVAERVRKHAEALGKPVRFGLLGPGRPDLTAIAREVVESVGATWTAPERWTGAVSRGRPGGRLRGLYAGGTLCEEARLLATEHLGDLTGHVFVDFGDDQYTQGRPHPMIDGSVRVDRLLAETDDPSAGVVLVDVVLGLGASPDPAGELADAVRSATAAGLPVVAAVVGTKDDPQDLRRQCALLADAGAWVHLSNAEAARTALDLLDGDHA